MKKAAVIASTAVLTIAFTLILLVMLPKAAKSDTQTTPAPSPLAEPTPTPMFSYTIEDPFITNMKDSKRYVKASIVLSLNEQADIETLETYNYIVKDAVIRVLRGTAEIEYLASDCQQELAEKIKSELNKVLSIGSIEEVYFMELVIQ